MHARRRHDSARSCAAPTMHPLPAGGTTWSPSGSCRRAATPRGQAAPPRWERWRPTPCSRALRWAGPEGHRKEVVQGPARAWGGTRFGAGQRLHRGRCPALPPKPSLLRSSCRRWRRCAAPTWQLPMWTTPTRRTLRLGCPPWARTRAPVSAWGTPSCSSWPPRVRCRPTAPRRRQRGARGRACWRSWCLKEAARRRRQRRSRRRLGTAPHAPSAA